LPIVAGKPWKSTVAVCNMAQHKAPAQGRWPASK
jgi:hypothetical protein